MSTVEGWWVSHLAPAGGCASETSQKPWGAWEPWAGVVIRHQEGWIKCYDLPASPWGPLRALIPPLSLPRAGLGEREREELESAEKVGASPPARSRSYQPSPNRQRKPAGGSGRAARSSGMGVSWAG